MGSISEWVDDHGGDAEVRCVSLRNNNMGYVYEVASDQPPRGGKSLCGLQHRYLLTYRLLLFYIAFVAGLLWIRHTFTSKQTLQQTSLYL